MKVAESLIDLNIIYHSCKVLEKLENAWKVLEFDLGKGVRTLIYICNNNNHE